MGIYTVEQALKVLCSNGSTVADYDVGFFHSLYARVEIGESLSLKQQCSAFRALGRYEPELASKGISIQDIDPPAEMILPDVPAPTKRWRDGAVRLTVENNRLHARSPFKYKDVCKSIGEARWSGDAKAWTYPATESSAFAVRSAFRSAYTEEDALFGLLADAHETRQQQSHAARDAGDLPDIPIAKTEAWLHQKQAFWFSKDIPSVMLAMDMGTGKSKVAIDLVVNSGAKKVLILCPVSVLRVWPREFKIHAGEHCDVLSVRGNIAARVRAAEELFATSGKSCVVVVTNYEGAYRQPFHDWSVAQDWDYVICDESHRIKSANGVYSKYAAKVGRSAKNRLALTGTPMGQSPLDVFGQYRFLDPSVYGKSFVAFKNRYAISGGYGGHEIVGYQREEELAEKFYSIAFRVDASVLDLVPPTDVERGCELSPSARKLYTALEQDLYAEMSDGEVTISNVLTKLLRLQQITGGAVTVDGKGIEVVDDAKANLLAEMLEEIGPEPVVVFCRFVHDLDVVASVASELGRTYGELSGRRGDALDENARMSEGIQVAAVQIQAGGVGVDFTRSRYGIYYSLGFSLVDYQQSRKRLHRPGQEHHVTFVHLVAENTVDEKVYRALADRKKVIDYVLGGTPDEDAESDR